MIKKFFIPLLFFTALFGEEECIGPWLTGPLLTPSGHVVPKGYINFEPYVYYVVENGIYDSNWDTQPLPDYTINNYFFPFWVGLTEWMDIRFALSASWQETQNVSSMAFNDFQIEVDFQLLRDTKTNKLPGIKLFFAENFPTARYQKLDPDKLGTDIGGDGSFETFAGIVFSRTFEFPHCKYLAVRLNPLIQIPTKVNVVGYNVYGGSANTRACVKTPIEYNALLGLEYTLTQNWALAFDAQAHWENATTYTGFPGTDEAGNLLDLSQPSSFQFSIAPAIEYNFSSGLGIIGGGWFTLAGRNTSRFFSGVIALNYFGPNQKEPKYKFRSTGGAGASGGGGR